MPCRAAQNQVGRLPPATVAMAGVGASGKQRTATIKALLQHPDVVAGGPLQREPFGVGELVQDVGAALAEGRSSLGAQAEPLGDARVVCRPLAEQLQDAAGELIRPPRAQAVALPQPALPLIDDLGQVDLRTGEGHLGWADTPSAQILVGERSETPDGRGVVPRVRQRGFPHVVDRLIGQFGD
jgi:hypothetical protein